jgi:deoxyribodipyrimidine photo-lyase
MSDGPIIMWFRRDLRLADNPALHTAARSGQPIICLYNWSPDEHGGWAPGAASRWWLHRSLTSLQQSIEKRGGKLVIAQDNSLQVLRSLIGKTGAQRVVCNRCDEPALAGRDELIARELHDEEVSFERFNGSLLIEPGEVMTKQNEPYKAFTPFWKACQKWGEPDEPLPPPDQFETWSGELSSLEVDDLQLNPKHHWDDGLAERWSVGESSAHDRLGQFLQYRIADYEELRDRPDLDSTSCLSPYLAHGEISVRQAWHAVREAMKQDRRPAVRKSMSAFLRELGWREFSYHMLAHFPHTPDESWREQFRKFPWKDDEESLEKWQQGQTGYPIVDAGMRQLWRTGWMHNRVRMVVASFLTKDLLIPWQHGARWFWDTLVDADLANNTMGWQWSAGCGADAAPYFRVFNPVLQGDKHDPDGEYVRHWIGELSGLVNRWIHRPWEAPEKVRDEAAVKLGTTYPKPIVDHGEARDRALAAFEKVKRS